MDPPAMTVAVSPIQVTSAVVAVQSVILAIPPQSLHASGLLASTDTASEASLEVVVISTRASDAEADAAAS
jgi:hypothetical protein